MDCCVRPLCRPHVAPRLLSTLTLTRTIILIAATASLCCQLAIVSADNASSANSKRKRPNVLFLLADDMGYGDLPCYGHPYAQAPNICDRLAGAGTIFENFHVTGITCNPSRTGFMCGRHPATFPNYMADFGFQGVQTVTQMLRDKAGYNTAHFGKVISAAECCFANFCATDCSSDNAPFHVANFPRVVYKIMMVVAYWSGPTYVGSKENRESSSSGRWHISVRLQTQCNSACIRGRSSSEC
mmetsp:Transcript_8307/g.25013  ORF Transcript_8307/g.25013 Transcript_8307/m.25013 type:complete len:242 (-) Transcript_8307:2222-2947(-)